MDFVSILKTAVGLLEAAITAKCDAESKEPPIRQTKAADAYIKYKKAITHLLDILALHDDPFIRTQLELAFIEAEEMRRIATTELPPNNTGLDNLERRFRSNTPVSRPIVTEEPPAPAAAEEPPAPAAAEEPPAPAAAAAATMPSESFIQIPTMPNIPKYKITGGPISNKFVELLNKMYRERSNGNPLYVFIVFLDTLIHEMSEMSILRNGLINDKNRLISMTKTNRNDTQEQINKKFNSGTSFMFEILNKIEMQKHLYKTIHNEKMKDNDFLRIFYDIVSGGTDLEKRHKLQLYGDWSQRGGKRKTIRRKHKSKRIAKTRKRIA